MLPQLYNSSSYYRANPYFRQGYLPPGAFKNRHHQQFFSQIPTGQNYNDGTGKKHYKYNAYKSQIQQNHLMQSPEKNLIDSRIAMDKSYFRALNTIDIQGSTPGTIVSQAVKNKMKAQEELLRRRRQQMQRRQRQQIQYNNRNNNNNNKDNSLINQKSSSYDKDQAQRRRQFALRQFQKNKELNQLLSRKNYHHSQRNQQINHEQFDKSYEYQQNAQNLNQYQQYQQSQQQQQNKNPSIINQNKIKSYHSQYLQSNNHIKPNPNSYSLNINSVRNPILKNKIVEDENSFKMNQYKKKLNLDANQDEQYSRRLNAQDARERQYQQQYRAQANHYQNLQNKNIYERNRNQSQNQQRTQMVKKYQIQNQYSLNNNLKPQRQNYQQYQQQNNTIPYPHENSKYMKPNPQISPELQYQYQYQNQNPLIKKQQQFINNQQPLPSQQRLDSSKGSDYQYRLGSNYGSRQVHRKMNPTYLSFGSPTIGLAGKNTLGF